MTFGSYLRSLRLSAKWDLRDTAIHTGINTKRLELLENHISPQKPSGAEILSVLKAFPNKASYRQLAALADSYGQNALAS